MSASLPFAVTIDQGRRCPGCSKTLAIGDQARFASKDWPNAVHGFCHPRDLRLWHDSCVAEAVETARCPACGRLHPTLENGLCLL